MGGCPKVILLPAGTSIVLPVVYMDQPTGLLHIYLWRRLCGRQERRLFRKPPQGVIWITSSGGYLNFEFLDLKANALPLHQAGTCTYVKSGDNVVNAKGRANEIGQSWCPADLLDIQLPTTGTSQRPPIDPMQTHVA